LATNTGQVSIGTASPAGSLDVEGSQTHTGYFNNTVTAAAGYGVYAASASTTMGAAVYGTITGHSNSGYAGYFINTDTMGTNCAVKTDGVSE